MENTDFIATSNLDINTLWNDILDEIAKSVTTLSYDVWIKSLKVVDLKGNTLVIETNTKSARDKLLGNYFKTRIINACNKVYRMITNIEILVKDETEEKNDEFTLEKQPDVNNNQITLEKPKPESRFDPKQTFENYIVGSSNQFATAAAKAVAEQPSTKINPLFIYGGSGLGKTHLLFAIGNYVAEHHPELNVCYITTYKFVNDYTSALQNNNVNAFKETFSTVDILIIDDIQELINKPQTQVQFFNIFNELYQNGKQIVITSDKQPKELNPLEERLRSRFEWGMIADIGVPDIETRIAILNKKAQIERYNVSREVIEYIAEISTTNVREMEGYLQRVVFYANLNNIGVITRATAVEALKNIAKDDQETIDATKIIEIVCKFYGLKKEEILSRKRTKNIAEARQIAMYLITEYINIPLDSIGSIFGKDHSTVIYAKNKVVDDIKHSKKLEVQINDMKQMIEGK